MDRRDRDLTHPDVLIAGDVTYDLPALEEQRAQGFIAKVEDHRETLARVRSLVRDGIAYLPSHDPESPARLAGAATRASAVASTG